MKRQAKAVIQRNAAKALMLRDLRLFGPEILRGAFTLDWDAATAAKE